ncbi:MAG: RHS repeat protein, partial [Spirochaetaceae bacterium]|nr:RHS repeat protein [Spirochaetaceae bacterium]
MKRFTFLAVFFILGALAFSAGLGERTYKDEVGERLHKEATVDGKTLSKLVEVYSVIEYDRNGNLIHSKYSNGEEYWYEYDRNGNEIHSKDSDGGEYWHEYDGNGNEIHFK